MQAVLGLFSQGTGRCARCSLRASSEKELLDRVPWDYLPDQYCIRPALAWTRYVGSNSTFPTTILDEEPLHLNL